MELKHVKELMAAMGRTGTKKLLFKGEDFELLLERDGEMRLSEALMEISEEPPHRQVALQRATAALSKGKEFSAHLAVPSGNDNGAAPAKEASTSHFVTSPMVGTFYLGATPGDPPFVKAGDKIEKNSVVCIIEAMKVMNEVKAGVSGAVLEILVEDGHPVEFGTKLFRIS